MSGESTINLTGKTALVTGSTSGIGLEIAQQLASSGCRLMLHGIDSPDKVEQVIADVGTNGAPEVFFNDADLSLPAQAEALIAATIAKFGIIDILVNNAGIQHVAAVNDFSDVHWNKIIEINLSAPFRLIRHALPVMRDNDWGRIINIASAHGLVASEKKAAYVAAKHGLVGLTKTVALETAKDSVTCNAICPGFVHTPLVDAQILARAESSGMTTEAAAKAMLQEKQPSGCFVKPSDIASMVAFLCSAAAEQITGSTISMDGGWTAQ